MLEYDLNNEDVCQAIDNTLDLVERVVMLEGGHWDYYTYFSIRMGLESLILDADEQKAKDDLVYYPVGIFTCRGRRYFALFMSPMMTNYGRPADLATVLIDSILNPPKKHAFDKADTYSYADLFPRRPFGNVDDDVKYLVAQARVARLKIVRAFNPFRTSRPYLFDELAGERQACMEAVDFRSLNPFNFKPAPRW